MPDPDLYALVDGAKRTFRRTTTRRVFAALRAFHRHAAPHVRHETALAERSTTSAEAAPHRALECSRASESVTLASCPDGIDALVVADLARALAARRDGTGGARPRRARRPAASRPSRAALAFFAPEVEVLTFPAWDCQPYDRVSPNAAVVARSA